MDAGIAFPLAEMGNHILTNIWAAGFMPVSCPVSYSRVILGPRAGFGDFRVGDERRNQQCCEGSNPSWLAEVFGRSA